MVENTESRKGKTMTAETAAAAAKTMTATAGYDDVREPATGAGAGNAVAEDDDKHPVQDAKEIVRRLLGCSVVCRLVDGRTVSGRLVCVDRLYVNLWLFGCFEGFMFVFFNGTTTTVTAVLSYFRRGYRGARRWGRMLASPKKTEKLSRQLAHAFPCCDIIVFLSMIWLFACLAGFLFFACRTNIILADCVEERTVRASDYHYRPIGEGSTSAHDSKRGGQGDALGRGATTDANAAAAGNEKEDDDEEDAVAALRRACSGITADSDPCRTVKRRLAQAMVPGSKLDSVKMERAVFEACTGVVP
jgi:small nuclear ribonucleoprotein (snRNP)-like protein